MPYLIAIVVLVVVALGFTLFRSDNTTDTTPVETVTLNSSSTAQGEVVAVPADEKNMETADSTTSNAGSYDDGMYEQPVTYLTPARSEYKLDVALTIKNDIVTAATVAYSQGAEKDPNAQRFEAAYRTAVIGKSLDSINLSRVGGASLTTGAFNNALAEIKADAAA